MAQQEPIRRQLPPQSNVVFLCDNCIWPDLPSATAGSSVSRRDSRWQASEPKLDATVRSDLAQSLAAAFRVWKPVVTCRHASAAWRCLLASNILQAPTPALLGAQASLPYLTLQGANHLSKEGRNAYVALVKRATLKLTATKNMTFLNPRVAPSNAMISHKYYYTEPLICNNGFGYNFSFAMSAFVSSVVNGAEEGGYLTCLNAA